MIRLRHILVALILGGTIALPAGVAQDKRDAPSLQGRWKVTRLIKRGALKAADDIATMSFVFSKDTLKILMRGEETRQFRFEVNRTQTPHHIDITATSGSFKEQTLPGIFRLEKDSLLLCLPSDDNKTRPGGFESLGGVAPKQLLITLQRVKD